MGEGFVRVGLGEDGWGEHIQCVKGINTLILEKEAYALFNKFAFLSTMFSVARAGDNCKFTGVEKKES